MRKNILWVSNFAPIPAQVDALRQMFGADCMVVHKNISNSRMIAREYKQGGYADLVCVVPLAIMDHVCREGLHPLWSQMVESPIETGQKPDLTFRGKSYWFDGFRRVRRIGLGFAPLEKKQGVHRVARFTRHPAVPEEIAAIKKAFGPKVEIVEVTRESIKDAQEIIDTAQALMADEVLVVAPYSVYDQLVKSGIRPLWVKMEGPHFRDLRRIVSVQIELDPI